jgi:outer membrane protein assembly factor BamB
MSLSSHRRTYVLMAAAAAASLTISCSAADPEPTASPDATSPPPGTTASSLTVSTVEEVGAEQLTLPGDPDWFAVDDHGVWVQRGSGELALVDPETSEVTGSGDLGDNELCQGIGASYGAVWTCLGSDVIRVDASTFEVVARFKVKKQATQGNLVGAFDRVWVLTSDGSNLVGIDPTTNEVATEFELPARCSDVTVGDGVLWLPCNIDDRVIKLDPTTGEVLLDAEVPNPLEVAVDSEVWVGTAATTVKLDPETGEVLLEADAGAADGGIALDDDSVWVHNADDFVVELDRATGDRVHQITADVTSGGDMMVLDGELWVTAYDDQLLFRIQLS